MNSETNIFIVRHGETQWNAANIFQGNMDSPLTEKGIAQACQLKRLMTQQPIELACVSPLQRAKDTLDIILEERKTERIIINDLREINLGSWEGQPFDEIKKIYPEEYQLFWDKPHLFALSGAETFKQLQYRMVRVLDSLFVSGKNKNILLVSHWLAIKVALAYYTSIPLAQLEHVAKPENGAVLCLSQHKDKIYINRSIVTSL